MKRELTRKYLKYVFNCEDNSVIEAYIKFIMNLEISAYIHKVDYHNESIYIDERYSKAFNGCEYFNEVILKDVDFLDYIYETFKTDINEFINEFIKEHKERMGF